MKTEKNLGLGGKMFGAGVPAVLATALLICGMPVARASLADYDAAITADMIAGLVPAATLPSAITMIQSARRSTGLRCETAGRRKSRTMAEFVRRGAIFPPLADTSLQGDLRIYGRTTLRRFGRCYSQALGAVRRCTS